MSFPKYPEYKESGIEILTAIPIHWQVIFMKRFAQLAYGDALPTDMRDDGQIPVYGSNGIVGIHSTSNTKSPVILVGRKGSYGALNWSNQPVFAIDTVYFIDENYCSANLRWLFWTLHIADFSGCSQDTGVPGLSRSLAHNTCLPFPSSQEQYAIAAFLDRETAKIDTLVAEQEKLIDLLKEKRQAVISHAVTKGLDPNVPMKDSGVEWLGEVPEHWHVVQLKRILDEPMMYGANEAADDDTPNHPRFVRITDITEDGDLREDTFRSLPPSTASPYILQNGDILLARSGATVGKSFIYKDSWGICCFAGYLIRARAKREIMNHDFLYKCFQSDFYWKYIGSEQIQATIQNVSAQKYGSLVIPIPPISEQSDIVRLLAEEEKRIQELMQEAQKAISLLKERRSALISAAVTGKIDVRGLAEATQ